MTETDSNIIANQNSINKGQVFHHDKDACFKCKFCLNHFFREEQIQTHLCVDVEILKKWAKEGEEMQDKAQKHENI